jgi:hypothetical protein
MKFDEIILIFVSALAIAIVVMMLQGCSTPKPFVDGVEIVPPLGCIEARSRGINC